MFCYVCYMGVQTWFQAKQILGALVQVMFVYVLYGTMYTILLNSQNGQ